MIKERERERERAERSDNCKKTTNIKNKERDRKIGGFIRPGGDFLIKNNWGSGTTVPTVPSQSDLLRPNNLLLSLN